MEFKGSKGEGIFLAIDESLDVGRARRVEAEVMRRWAPGSRLVLDLSKVRSFNCSGVIALMEVLSRMRGLLSTVSIRGLSERIGRFFLEMRPPEAEWIYVRGMEAGKRKWM